MWPPHSPDISPIESVWASMANMLRPEMEVPRTRDELIALIADAWRRSTEPSVVRGHYEKIYGRMVTSLAMGGGNAMQ